MAPSHRQEMKPSRAALCGCLPGSRGSPVLGSVSDFCPKWLLLEWGFGQTYPGSALSSCQRVRSNRQQFIWWSPCFMDKQIDQRMYRWIKGEGGIWYIILWATHDNFIKVHKHEFYYDFSVSKTQGAGIEPECRLCVQKGISSLGLLEIASSEQKGRVITKVSDQSRLKGSQAKILNSKYLKKI